MVKNLLKNPPANAGDLGDKFNPWVRKIIWRRAWPPTPVSLPGEAQGQRSLAGYSPWGYRDAAARRGWSGSACMCSICTGLKSIKQEGPFSRGFYTKKVPFLTNSHLLDFVVYECRACSCLGCVLRCQKVRWTHRFLDLRGPPSLGHWLCSPELPKPGWSLQPTAPQPDPWAE